MCYLGDVFELPGCVRPSLYTSQEKPFISLRFPGDHFLFRGKMVHSFKYQRKICHHGKAEQVFGPFFIRQVMVAVGCGLAMHWQDRKVADGCGTHNGTPKQDNRQPRLNNVPRNRPPQNTFFVIARRNTEATCGAHHESYGTNLNEGTTLLIGVRIGRTGFWCVVISQCLVAETQSEPQL